MKSLTLIMLLTAASPLVLAQKLTPEEYEVMKAAKPAEMSPFEKIVDRELPATIVYENDYVIAFIPLRPQAPVLYLIVPKKRINTARDITEADGPVLTDMFLAAKEVAKKFGVAQTGYRLAINTKRDVEQSKFHLHMHLLGGEFWSRCASEEIDPG